MQTIKVNTHTNATGSVTTFSVNGTCVAHVGTDLHNVGRYAGRINHAGGASYQPRAQRAEATNKPKAKEYGQSN